MMSLIKEPISQRDFMRKLLEEHGYNEQRVRAAYAAADRSGQVPRNSNMNRMSSEDYAREVWLDGHRPRAPWILKYCEQRGLKV